MRDLTEAELNEYFAFCKRDLKPADFNEAQTHLVGVVAREWGLLAGMTRKLDEAEELGLTEEDIVVSFWVWAFQMGRECESRLITQALKVQVGQ